MQSSRRNNSEPLRGTYTTGFALADARHSGGRRVKSIGGGGRPPAARPVLLGVHEDPAAHGLALASRCRGLLDTAGAPRAGPRTMRGLGLAGGIAAGGRASTSNARRGVER